jgi:uncharacterized repeat protein (TIGR01451 family)
MPVSAGRDQMGSIRMKAFLVFAALIVPTAAPAANRLSLASDVFVERIERDPSGRTVATLAPPRAVTPGDRLVFVLSYRNAGQDPASGFVVTNPVPDTVAFVEADDKTAQVSVDGGRSWGDLPSLHVTAQDGRTRPARPTDVTHVRWQVRETVPAGQIGKLSYRAVAR